MGCGCGKKSTVVAPPISGPEGVQAAVRQSAPILYDVFNGEGSLVASYSNPATARAESRRVGGNVVPKTTAPSGVTADSLTK